MTDDERLERYASMWTTDVSRYALIEFDPTRPTHCIVLDLTTGGLIAFDDADDVVQTVLTRMRSAGVRIMTPEEARPK